MSTVRLYKTLLLSTVVLSILAYVYADPNLPLALLSLSAIALGWWLTEVRAAFKIPSWATYLAVAIIIARAGTRIAAEGLNVSVFCEFLTLVLILKVWDHHRARDQGQILTLCAFLALGAILTDTSLVLGLLLAGLVPLLLGAVMLFQVRPDERLALAPRAIASDHAPGRRPRLLHAFALSLITLWVGSIVLFVYFPREIGFAALGRWGIGMQSGFADHVELGRAGLISESQETVLELELRDGTGASHGGPSEVYYLRGAVLDQYRPETGSWTRSDHNTPNNTFESTINNTNQPVSLSESGNQLRPISPRDQLIQTITVRDGASGPVFCIWRPKVITFLSTFGKLTFRTADRSMIRPHSPGPFRYSVQSDISLNPAGGPEERHDASFPIPFVHEVAARILRDQNIEPDPDLRPVADIASAAAAIESYLRNSYSYTLDIQAPPPGMDPIEWFLRDAREGHCEYFASAMAALCLSVGIEARVITGYVATEWDDIENKYIVRESNAHAWVEARVSSYTWRTFDPTPQADLRRVHQPKMDFASRLRRLFDSAESRWARSVVGYDEDQRRTLLGAKTPIISWIEGKMRTVSEATSPRAARAAVRNLQRMLFAAIGWLGVAIATLMLIPAAYRALARRLPRLRRRHASLAAPARADDPDLRFYRALLAVLERRGVPKPDSRPPLRHADQLAAVDPALADTLSSISNLYYKAVFGGLPLTQEELRRADDLVRRAARTGGAPRHTAPKPRPAA